MRITLSTPLLILLTTILATAAPVMSSTADTPANKLESRVEAQPVSPVQGSNGMSAARKAMAKSMGKAQFVQGKIEEQKEKKGELKARGAEAGIEKE